MEKHRKKVYDTGRKNIFIFICFKTPIQEQSEKKKIRNALARIDASA